MLFKPQLASVGVSSENFHSNAFCAMSRFNFVLPPLGHFSITLQSLSMEFTTTVQSMPSEQGVYKNRVVYEIYPPAIKQSDWVTMVQGCLNYHEGYKVEQAASNQCMQGRCIVISL